MWYGSSEKVSLLHKTSVLTWSDRNFFKRTDRQTEARAVFPSFSACHKVKSKSHHEALSVASINQSYVDQKVTLDVTIDF
jgi:hypothetical protein